MEFVKMEKYTIKLTDTFNNIFIDIHNVLCKQEIKSFVFNKTHTGYNY